MAFFICGHLIVCYLTVPQHFSSRLAEYSTQGFITVMLVPLQDELSLYAPDFIGKSLRLNNSTSKLKATTDFYSTEPNNFQYEVTGDDLYVIPKISWVCRILHLRTDPHLPSGIYKAKSCVTALAVGKCLSLIWS